MRLPDALSRVHVDSLFVDSVSIDLGSADFTSEQYVALKEKVTTNKDHLPDLEVIDEKVFIRVELNRSNDVADRSCWKLWVPDGLIPDLIASAHDVPLAAHGGIAKTIDRVKRSFY